VAAEQALTTLKEALGGTDLSAITAATEALMVASQKFATQAYEQASQENAQYSPGEASGDAAEEVVDAEVVEDDK
jgi:molecular chaperone DnaK